MKEAKWLYRLESHNPNNGLWYNINGEKAWGIGVIEGETKNLPMEYDERYHVDGRNWFSSCSNKEDLIHWYSLEDALNLIENHGFVFTRYLATEYIEYEKETVFIKETALLKEELNIEEIFCDFCKYRAKGDTLYELDHWDGGIEFNYVEINYCPRCGRKLKKEEENE